MFKCEIYMHRNWNKILEDPSTLTYIFPFYVEKILAAVIFFVFELGFIVCKRTGFATGFQRSK